MKTRRKIIEKYLNSIDVDKMIMERHHQNHLVGLMKHAGFTSVDYLVKFDDIESEADVKLIIDLMIESLTDKEIFPEGDFHFDKVEGERLRSIEIPDPNYYLIHIILKMLVAEGFAIEANGKYMAKEKFLKKIQNKKVA